MVPFRELNMDEKSLGLHPAIVPRPTEEMFRHPTKGWWMGKRAENLNGVGNDVGLIIPSSDVTVDDDLVAYLRGRPVCLKK